ncbi:MAG: 3-hydroxyacyl-CoA dehydrogenase family protein [Chloroflexota bacterium]
MNVEKLAVLGSGTMGHGIAQVAAAAGLNVTLYDIDQAMLDNAVAKITASVEKFLVGKAKITPEAGQALLARLRTTTDLADAASDADFIIEAIPEKLELKQQVFAGLDRLCPAHTILATNTSVLPVTAIAGATNRPAQCIGAHFFNPAAVMKLVEVVLPLGVADETVETTLVLCRRLGKTPITCKDLPGFIVNRLLGKLYQEAAQMVLEGVATAEEIDTAMKLGAGHPMGPCELADFGGFDVIQMATDAIYNYTHQESDRLCILYRKMLEAGRLGRKNGKGFYDYAPDGTKTPARLFD